MRSAPLHVFIAHKHNSSDAHASIYSRQEMPSFYLMGHGVNNSHSEVCSLAQ